jgi:hypothetical protein
MKDGRRALGKPDARALDSSLGLPRTPPRSNSEIQLLCAKHSLPISNLNVVLMYSNAMLPIRKHEIPDKDGIQNIVLLSSDHET